MINSVNYYPDEFKIKVVRHYLETDDGFVATAKKFNLSCHALVSNWLRKYRNENGQPVVVKTSKFNPKYTEAFKIEVARHYVESKDSLIKTAEKFNVKSLLSVRAWVDKYRHLLPDVNGDVGRFDGYLPPITMNKPAETSDQALLSDPLEMAKRIKQLEISLTNEQFKNISLNTMIDVAEEELQISIRKKSGAKQLRK